MTEVFLGLGSNVNREWHLREGIRALRERFGCVQLSPVFESESVGFAGSAFFNLVASIKTDLSVGELQQALRAIEFSLGRAPNQRKYSPRTLDIDILTYGDVVGDIEGVCLPRGEILENAFVLWPLACLAPDNKHPQVQISYQQLWEAYDKSRQKLLPVAVALEG